MEIKLVLEAIVEDVAEGWERDYPLVALLRGLFWVVMCVLVGGSCTAVYTWVFGAVGVVDWIFLSILGLVGLTGLAVVAVLSHDAYTKWRKRLRGHMARLRTEHERVAARKGDLSEANTVGGELSEVEP